MKRIYLYLFLFVLLPQFSPAEEKPRLVFNEIMVANVDQFIDPSWNYGLWAEIYNAGDKDVELRGYWVSDDPEQPKKVCIPCNLKVPAKGFATLWFDHHDRYRITQLPLKLDADGGMLVLSSLRGTPVTQAEFPPCIPRASYARTSDGAEEWQWSSTPTPGTSNRRMTFCRERLPAPEVNLTSRIFSGTLDVAVTIPEGCTLRYTTDGKTPTQTQGRTSSDGLFSVTKTTILRFALFREGYLSSPVVTRSYLLRDKTFSLPVVSVVTDPGNLYSDKMGIFVRGVNGRPGHGEDVKCNWNMEWDRPCNFELLDEEGNSLVNQETLVRRCGGWSRAWTPYSFKIHAVKTAEFQNRLNYPFFEAKPYLSHKVLQIRNGGNDNEVRIKDPFFQQIVATSGLDIDYQEYQPVAHYINGIYKGVINMREPNNKHHVYANYGLDEEEIDLFEMDSDSGYVQQCGTNEAWKTLVTESRYCKSEAIYERIVKMLDIDEYCNYMAVAFYGGNIDWPYNNVKGFRPVQEDGRFRFILYDVDKCFRTDTPFTRFESQNVHQFGLLYGEPVEHYTLEVEMVTLFLNLLRNDTFRKHFIDTFCLVTGSVFEPKRCRKIIERLTDRIAEMQVLDDNGYHQNNDPAPTAQSMISSLNKRQALMIDQLKAFPQMKLDGAAEQTVSLRGNLPAVCVQVNGQTIPTGEFCGTLFPPVTLKATAPAGYKFVAWATQDKMGTGPLKYYGGKAEMKLPFSTEQLNLVAVFESMSETVGHVQRKVVVNEVSAANSIYVSEYFKKSDWIELYNTTEEDIDLAGMYLSDDPENPRKCQIQPGNEKVSTLLPAFGRRIVWCDERESATQLHINFKLKNEDGAMVMLTAEDQSWADTLVYCSHDGLQTVGRFPDGGQEVYLMSKPSIEKANIMNHYTTLCKPGASGNGLEGTSVRQGGLSLMYGSDRLNLKSEEDCNVRLAICDLSGKTAAHYELMLEDWHGSVSVADLPPGFYIARLTDSQGNACTLKFRKRVQK